MNRAIMLLALGVLPACRPEASSTKANVEILLPESHYAVSMSAYLADTEGLVLPSMYRKVGSFHHTAESCEGAGVDLSSAINDQVKAAGGNAIVNFSVIAESAGCMEVEFLGDIVAASAGAAQ
jgi:hypothetical protein